MKELLEDKDIVIAILALITPILTILGRTIEKIFDYRKENIHKIKERNNSRRNVIYTNFLDVINELDTDNLRLFDDSYNKKLIHSFNEVQLYAGKKLREQIKKLRVYINSCKEEFVKEFNKQGYSNKYEYMRELAEYDNYNCIEVEMIYDNNLKDLKLSCIDKKKIKLELDKIIDLMSEELLMNK